MPTLAEMIVTLAVLNATPGMGNAYWVYRGWLKANGYVVDTTTSPVNITDPDIKRSAERDHWIKHFGSVTGAKS